MCLSSAGRIRTIEGENAVVVVGGTARRASLAMLLLEGQPAVPGDWVLIHTGFAVAVLDAEEGAALDRLRRELDIADAETADSAETANEEVQP